jgi:hypothetical protein
MISNKQKVRRRFSICLGRAEKLLDIVTGHTNTDPTFKEVATLMKLRAGLAGQFPA